MTTLQLTGLLATTIRPAHGGEWEYTTWTTRGITYCPLAPRTKTP